MFKLLDRHQVHVCVEGEADGGSPENIMLKVDGSEFQGRDGMIIIISSISNYYSY